MGEGGGAAGGWGPSCANHSVILKIIIMHHVIVGA